MKHLSSIINSKLDWSQNALALLKKGNQRLYFMKRLKSFNVCPKLLELFYRSTVELAVTFNSLCHFGSLIEQDKARLFKVTKTASRLNDRPVMDLQAHFEAKAVKCLEGIQCDPTHPLNKELQAYTSARSGGLISFRARTSRFHSSFLPFAVCLSKTKQSVVDWDRLCADGTLPVSLFYCLFYSPGAALGG